MGCKCVWPAVTLAVIVVAVIIYIFFPPSCSDTTSGSKTTEVPAYSPTTPAASSTPSGRMPWEIDHRLPPNLQPLHYDVLLYPDLISGTFSGVVSIIVNMSELTTYIPLHVDTITVKETKLTSIKGDQVQLKRSFEYLPNQFWVLLPREVLIPGQYRIELVFNGSMVQDIVGLYMSSYTDSTTLQTKNIATTKFEPTYARRAFPCFDEPSFKAKYNVSLVRPSNGNYIALSNMNQVGEIMDSPTPGYTTVNFATSVAMSTYLACFIVCDFDHLPSVQSKHSVNVTVYARNGQTQKMDYALQIATSTIDYYIDYFSIDYPLPKLDLIAIPDFVSGAMENWGLITFRETNVLYDPEVSSSSNHLQVTLTNTHELAHMWFGDLVTMEWWDDLWLNEGFATFMSFKGTAHNHPDWDLDSIFVILELTDSLHLDSFLSSHPIIKHVSHPDQITEIFDRISYAKGASVIRMLEGFMGNENFRQGVTSYLKTFQYKNAETKDLWHHLQKFSPNVNIERVMDTWTRQMGLPVLTVTNNEGVLSLSQQRFLMDKNASYDDNESTFKYKWDIPVTYITSEKKEPTLTWLLLENSSISINLGKVEWYKLNWHFMNYYRVNYPVEHWTTLTNLLVKDIKALDAADRANLIDDAFALATSGHLDYSVALAVTTFLPGEDHYVVWSVAASHLLDTEKHLRFTPAYSDYRRYLRKLVAPFITDSLWNSSPDTPFLQRLLNMQLLSLGCRAGVPTCLNKAKQLFIDWLKNNGPKPHADVRFMVYFYGIAESGEEEWDKLWDAYLLEQDPQDKLKMRQALCAVKEPWIIARLIDRAKNEDYVRSQDYFPLLGAIASNPVGNSVLWDWVRANWQYLVDRFSLNNRMFGRLIPSVVGSYSSQVKLNEVQAFLAQHPEEGAGASGRKTAVETIKLNILWLERHLPTLTSWLKKSSQ